MESKYRELSIKDDLTGLYNSRYFFSQLKEEVERSERYGSPLTLLLLDLDNFKSYNDTYGHLEGDRLLTNFGKIFEKSVRNLIQPIDTGAMNLRLYYRRLRLKRPCMSPTGSRKNLKYKALLSILKGRGL